MKKSLLLLPVICLISAITIPPRVLPLQAQANPATFALDPNTATYTPGQAVSLNLQINTADYEATAITVAIDVTGSVPSDLAITAEALSGMTTATANVATTNAGKQIQLAYTATAAGNTYTSSGNLATLATITYTAPSSGTTTFNFNSAISGIYISGGSNVVSLPTASTYTVTSTVPTNTPIPPTNTPIPPTNTPIPPTNTPTPSATPIPINGSLTLNFRLQGITAAVAAQTTTVSLKDPDTGEVISTQDVSLTPDNTGLFTTTLTGLSAGTYQVCLKTPTHLTKCSVGADIPNVNKTHHPVLSVETPAVTTDFASKDINHLLAGDVNHDNLITLMDSTLALNALKSQPGSFSVPVASLDPTLTGADVNLDGFVSILDIALLQLNFTDFEIPGD